MIQTCVAQMVFVPLQIPVTVQQGTQVLIALLLYVSVELLAHKTFVMERELVTHQILASVKPIGLVKIVLFPYALGKMVQIYLFAVVMEIVRQLIHAPASQIIQVQLVLFQFVMDSLQMTREFVQIGMELVVHPILVLVRLGIVDTSVQFQVVSV